jgi:hypothetical protein
LELAETVNETKVRRAGKKDDLDGLEKPGKNVLQCPALLEAELTQNNKNLNFLSLSHDNVDTTHCCFDRHHVRRVPIEINPSLKDPDSEKTAYDGGDVAVIKGQGTNNISRMRATSQIP